MEKALWEIRNKGVYTASIHHVLGQVSKNFSFRRVNILKPWEGAGALQREVNVTDSKSRSSIKLTENTSETDNQSEKW